MIKDFFSKNLWSMLASLLLAFLIWLNVAGQDVSTIDVELPLLIKGFPVNLATEEELPKSIIVRVAANDVQGKFLLEDKKQSLILDISDARVGSNVFKIDASQLHLPRGVQVKSIEPENIMFNAYQLVNKIVKVEASIKGKLNSDYELGPVLVKPESVAILGAVEELEDLDLVKSTPIDVSTLTQTETIKALVEVEDISKHFTITPSELLVEVNIMPKMHETEIILPLQLESKYLEEEISLLNKNIIVKIKWPLYAKLSKEFIEIKAVASIKDHDITTAETISVPVELVFEDKRIEIIEINPPEVQVKMQPKNDENKNLTSDSNLEILEKTLYNAIVNKVGAKNDK